MYFLELVAWYSWAKEKITWLCIIGARYIVIHISSLLYIHGTHGGIYTMLPLWSCMQDHGSCHIRNGSDGLLRHPILVMVVSTTILDLLVSVVICWTNLLALNAPLFAKYVQGITPWLNKKFSKCYLACIGSMIESSSWNSTLTNPLAWSTKMHPPIYWSDVALLKE